MRRLAAPLLALACVAAAPSPARAESVLVEVIAGGSQNMWQQTKGVYRISILRSGLRKAHAALPEGVEMGIRAYGLDKDRGVSRRVLPIALHANKTVAAAVRDMNPAGRVEIVTAVREAEQDFAGREGRRVVVLIAAGADETVGDACAALEGAGERLRAPIHVLGLDVNAARERDQLKCIADRNGGLYKDVRSSDAIVFNVRLMLKDVLAAVEREAAERIAEARRRALMADRTRVRIRFANDIDPFFAEEARLVECAIDGEAVPLDSAKAAAEPKEIVEVADRPTPVGTHTLTVRYAKRRGGRDALSEVGEAQFVVEDGRTTDVLVTARGGLTKWKVRIAAETLPAGEGGA